MMVAASAIAAATFTAASSAATTTGVTAAATTAAAGSAGVVRSGIVVAGISAPIPFMARRVAALRRVTDRIRFRIILVVGVRVEIHPAAVVPEHPAIIRKPIPPMIVVVDESPTIRAVAAIERLVAVAHIIIADVAI